MGIYGLNLEQGLINFDLQKQKSFGPEQIYTFNFNNDENKFLSLA